MGLDVRLYYCEDLDTQMLLEKEYEAKCEDHERIFLNAFKIDNVFDLCKEDQAKLESICAKEASNLHLNSWGRSEKIVEIDKPSKKYPSHLFSIGKIRSSYNIGGINSVLEELGLEDLFWVFNFTEEDQQKEYVSPNWNQSLVNIKQLIENYTKAMATDLGKYTSFEIPVDFLFNGDLPCSRQTALNKFIESISTKERLPGFNSYSNRDGDFFLEGEKVYSFLKGINLLGNRSMYIVTDRNHYDPKTKGDWYLQALEIVQETIEFVLAQSNTSAYYLAWCG